MKYEDITRVTKEMGTVDIKGKDYVQVNDRVLAFRKLFPDGDIITHIESLCDGVVVIRADVLDNEGKHLASGVAYEKEGSTFINKTSYIENCETSAVGRALGFLGIGIDTSICSAEELQTAVINQEGNETISATQAKGIKAMLEDTNSDTTAFLKMVSDKFGRQVKSVDELTKKEYAYGTQMIQKKISKGGK